MRSKTQPSPTTFRRLTRNEIERRIDGVIEAIAAADQDAAEVDMSPRFISAAELVRRMRPFVSLN